MEYEKIIPTLKERYPYYGDFRIDGKTLFKRHCGERMYRVRTFLIETICPEHPDIRQGYDILVCSCPTCNVSYSGANY